MTDRIKSYLKLPFVICTLVLLLANISMTIAITKFKVYLTKEPLPLNKSFDLINESKLSPYKVVSKSKIKDEDVLKKLGTNEYIQWVLLDPELPGENPVSKCMLFLTYYDLPDRVPHVPEECYVGGGNMILDTKIFDVEINNSGAPFKIYAKYLVMSSTDSQSVFGSSKFCVIYFFRVNGQYANSREDARLYLNKNIFGKHSYFSKVEWKFFSTDKFGNPIYPSADEAVKASKKLLNVIVPLLEKEHWPSDSGDTKK